MFKPYHFLAGISAITHVIQDECTVNVAILLVSAGLWYDGLRCAGLNGGGKTSITSSCSKNKAATSCKQYGRRNPLKINLLFID